MRAFALLAAALLLAACPWPLPSARPPSADGPAALPACALAWADLPAHARAPQPGDYDGYYRSVQRDMCKKPWTVLLYMAADNQDLPLHAYWNLRDLETAAGAASSDHHDIIVHLDLPGPSGLRRLHIFNDPGAPAPTATELAGAAPDLLRSPVVAFDPDESTPPADTLREFVTWAARAYPSERLMVILWGHGQGWRPALIEPPEALRYRPGGFVGGIAFDHGEGTVLDIPSLHSALAALPRPVDVLAADACLMQTVEVGLELQSVARYLVGYPQIAPYPGLPYSLLLPAFTAPALGASACPPLDDACQLAERIPAIYGRAVDAGHYALRAPDDAIERTYVISVVATQPLGERLAPALHDLGAALDAWRLADPLRAIDLQALLAPGGLPGFLGGTRDLGVFAAGLRHLLARERSRAPADPPSPASVQLGAALDRLDAALLATVLARSLGDSYRSDPPYPGLAVPGGLAGLAVWLPRDEGELRTILPRYQSAPLFARTGAAAEPTPWERWLLGVYAAPPE